MLCREPINLGRARVRVQIDGTEMGAGGEGSPEPTLSTVEKLGNCFMREKGGCSKGSQAQRLPAALPPERPSDSGSHCPQPNWAGVEVSVSGLALGN